ncbi:MAG: hypothetical protein GXP04_12215 [Alphaproteobacteria bacterium]|nr:hypothetical protein [Alphaproteobacteria bacterium]
MPISSFQIQPADIANAGSVIQWAVTTGSAVVVAIAAWRGVELWREKLHGTSEYAVCTETLKAVWELYSAMRSVQAVELLDLEISRFTSKISEDIAGDKTSAARYYDMKAQATSARLERVLKAREKLAETLPSVAAVIDPRSGIHVAELLRLSEKMFQAQERIERKMRFAPIVNIAKGNKAIETDFDSLFDLLVGAGGKNTIDRAYNVINKLETELEEYMPPKRRRRFKKASALARKQAAKNPNAQAAKPENDSPAI